MLKLGEILDQEAFGLRQLTGGAAGRERAVEGAHNSEMPGPSQFLPAGWVMLTLGIKLRGNVKAQRALVAELDEARLSALGFGIGVAFEHVPRPILEEAEKRDFPVFEIPFATPYREIIGFVNRSRLSPDLRLVQRSLSMQNYLMDALRDEHPLDALVHRLGELLDSTIIMFSDHGTVTAASRDAPFEAIWEQVSTADQPSVQRALIDGADTLAIPIESPGRARLWLVVASRRRSLPRQLALSVIQTTERLLDLIAISQRAAAAEDRVLRAEVLVSALAPARGQDRLELRARMTRFGLSFDARARMLAIETVDAAPDALDRIRVALERALEDRNVPYLMALRESRLLVFAQASSPDLHEILGGSSVTDGVAIRVGGGRRAKDLDDLPQSLRDAEVALRNLALRDAQGLLLFEDFDLSSWLVGTTPPDDLRAKADLVLHPLHDHPELIETVVTYLRLNMRVAATAQALNLHENSLRYRLNQIEKLLGKPLRDLSTLVDLYLATLTRETHGGRG